MMSPCMYGFMLSKTNKYVVHGKKKKDFMYDCSVTNSSVVVDSISTLSEWTGEHSRQYLESPSSEDVMKDFMYDSLYKIMTERTHYLT